MVAVGIIVAVILFKIYPNKSDNPTRRRLVQIIISIALLTGIIVSIIFMKFMVGILLGIVGIFYAFKQRKRQLDGVFQIASLFKNFTDKNK